MSIHNRFLKLKIIWKDDDMFELEISANNGRYSGTTEVYEQKEPLLNFANRLDSFPNKQKVLVHSIGEKDGYSFFEMKFYQLDPTGKVGVLIALEENVSTTYRPEEKHKLTMELLVEPNAIDQFQKELVSLAKNEEGSAELVGIAN
jgi:hypothetical protein